MLTARNFDCESCLRKDPLFSVFIGENGDLIATWSWMLSKRRPRKSKHWVLLLSPSHLNCSHSTGNLEKKLTFEILSDPGNEVAQRYGLKFQLPGDLREVYLKFNIDLPKYNGDDSWTLPLPARLIIDQEGIIRYAAINADYTVRPEIEETIAALKSMIG
jgi:peroxiredoxin